MRVPFPLPTQTNEETSSRQQDRARLVNLYLDDNVLRTCVAMNNDRVIFSKPNRIEGAFCWKGDFYAASGGKLWNVTTGDELGNIGTGPAKFKNEGDNFAIVCDMRYFVWTGTELLEPDTGVIEGVLDVDFLDGFIIIIGADGRFGASELGAPASFDALDFATAESAPDGLVGVVVSGRNIILFGENTIEVWYNSGNADFPFSRFDGGAVERGAIGAITEIDSAVYFVSDDLRVLVTEGEATRPLSTPVLDRILQGDEDHPGYGASDIKSFTFNDAGNKYYVLCFPDRPAWMLNTRTGKWSERSSGVAYGPWLATCAAYDPSERRWYVGTDDGRLVQLQGRTEDDGKPYLRSVTGSLKLPDRNPFTVDELELDMKVGRSATDVVCRLETSKDGETWDQARQRGLGDVGEYGRLVRWHSLGQYREFHARMSCTDPVDVQLFWAVADVTKDAA